MIDLEQARGLLARAVMTQGPDFVYSKGGQACRYQPITRFDDIVTKDDPRTKTGCLIGTAAKLAGIDTREWDGTIAGYVSRKFGHLFGPGVTDYWQTAQNAQDSGATWGEAFAEAELSLESGGDDKDTVAGL